MTNKEKYPEYIYKGINSGLASDWIWYFIGLLVVSIILYMLSLIYNSPPIIVYLTVGLMIVNATIVLVMSYVIKNEL